MAFLHCHDCDWSQDDFWSETYYPKGDYAAEILLAGITDPEKRTITFSKGDAEAIGIPEDIMGEENSQGEITIDFRAYAAWQLMRNIRRITNMRWITYEEYINDPNKVCPVCKSTELDID